MIGDCEKDKKTYRKRYDMVNHLSTIEYYNNNVEPFTSGTVNADMSETHERFLKYLPYHSLILDFGCGSGRDTKAFLDKGFRVEAIDGSEELCKFASRYTGIRVKCMLFQELDEYEKYDGIWACSSILHLSETELKDVMIKMSNSLKYGGVIYTSFKYSDYEGERNGRYFIDFTEDKFNKFLSGLKSLKIIDQWITSDVRPDRDDEKWLNLILKK